jgi:hypothetical protein
MFFVVSISISAVIAFLVLFLGVIPLIIGSLGGWAALGRQYSFAGKFTGPIWRFQDMTLRKWCGYNGCVSIGANSEGIYLNTFFWPLHPPLFIPWQDLTAKRRDVKLLVLRIGVVDFVASRVPDVTITLRETVIERMAAARACSNQSPSMERASPERPFHSEAGVP